ncbi:hypothetical protein [Hoyosella altamirensis]|uniref:Uncharacterized protein n=1 Tax=Hoyosella altamirensis TaxID=616997 RepID=A0A839RTL4_9ACTN|nr:hypothetical protein [Hoyosella altamirensis]MBB3039558.1 hypothetical protein [Hoyosella altamirensis]
MAEYTITALLIGGNRDRSQQVPFFTVQCFPYVAGYVGPAANAEKFSGPRVLTPLIGGKVTD